jgi:hypothetical protein
MLKKSKDLWQIFLNHMSNQRIEKVWNELGSSDVRDVVKVARLASTIEEIPFVLRMLNKQQWFDGTNKN